MVKIIQVNRHGGPEHLTFEDIDAVEPGSGEVRFNVHAFALNRADLQYIKGAHYNELKLPSRLGSEACGIVDAVGSGVNTFRVGDHVSSVPFHSEEFQRHGVHGEIATVPAKYLTRWPQGLSAVEACSIWMQYLTAYFALAKVAEVGPGTTVLLTAASGSAGVGAIQIAKALGASVIATTRQARKRDFLEQNGADHVVITTLGENFAASLQEFTGGKGVDVVFDPVAGKFVHDYVDGLNWGGRVLIYGNLSGTGEFSVPILPLIRAKGSIHPYSMFNHVMIPEELKEGVDFVMSRIADSQLRPVIARVFDFKDAISAYQYMLGNSQCGKIVVDVKPNIGDA